MGEYFPAEIRIGGKIKDAELRKLFLLIGREYGSAALAGYPTTSSVEYSEFKRRVLDSGAVIVEDVEAKSGHFYSLEEFCGRVGLPYQRFQQAHGHGESDAAICWWHPRPGYAGDYSEEMESSCYATSSQEPLIRSEEVLAILELGSDMQNRVREKMPPPLPPLEVLEDGSSGKLYS